jgi:hypothetical protein
VRPATCAHLSPFCATPTAVPNARDALLLLGELDLELLVQVALDTLIRDYVEDPGLAHQTRREIRGNNAGAARS